MSVADEIKRESSHLDHLNQQATVQSNEGEQGRLEVTRKAIAETEARIKDLRTLQAKEPKPAPMHVNCVSCGGPLLARHASDPPKCDKCAGRG